MADNVPITAGAGTTIATDDVAGVHYQYMKLADGTLDSAAVIPGDATNGLDVDVTRVQGTVTADVSDRAARDCGKIDIAAFDVALPTGANVIGHVIADAGSTTVVTGSVAVTNAALAVVGGGVEATALRVTVASDSTGVLSVDDNGASLTVDNANLENATLVDNAAFTDGTTRVVMGGYVFDDVAGVALTENDAAASRINSNRAAVYTIEDGATRARYATVTAANALKVDASGVAVPVTDNAGSLTIDNSTLAVVGGGTEATAMRVTVANDSTGVLSIDDNGGSLTVDLAGGTDVAIGRVKITDGTTVAGVIVGTTALKADTASIAGTATVTAAAGVQKVGVVGGTNTSLETTAGVLDQNIKNVGNAAVSTAASGVQKVGVVGNAGAIFDGATAAAVPANAVYQGGRGTTANPTAVTDGQQVGSMRDKVGRTVVVQGHVRDLIGVQTTAIASSSAETTIITAGGVNVFNDITHLSLTNATATAVTATLKDSTAGTTRAKYDLAASGGIVLTFNPPMPQLAAANNNWTITLSSAAVTVDINAVFVKNL